MRTILVILSIAIFSSAYSQNKKKFFLETEYQIKFSFGKPSYYEQLLYGRLVVQLPKIATYNYPVNQLNVTANYQLSKHYLMGLGIGFAFTKYEPIPLISYSYYDKIAIPMYLRLRYNYNIKSDWMGLVDVDAGYQYSNNRWDFINSEQGFKKQEYGGALLSVNVGFGKPIKSYVPFLKLGYEFNSFKREYVYIFSEPLQPIVYQRVTFNTFYHLLKLSLSISL